MAKRFTDTDKWRKPFIKSLPTPYKLLWLYMLDDCNHAGIWQVDLEVAALRVGESLELDQALRLFQGRIVPFDNGAKWFIPAFIDFQYKGELNKNIRVHNAIIKELQRCNLLQYLSAEIIENKSPFEAPSKPLRSPLQNLKKPLYENEKGATKPLQDKDKDKDMDKDKEMEGGAGETFADMPRNWPEIKAKLQDDTAWHATLAFSLNGMGLRCTPEVVRGMMVQFIQERELHNDTSRDSLDMISYAINFAKAQLRKGRKPGTTPDNDEPIPPSRKYLN